MEYNDLARIRSLVALYPHRRTVNLLEGNFPSVYRSRGMEFDSLTEYTPGDDVRDIDWKASSGTDDSILVRKYVATRKYNLLLIGDVGLKMTGDTSLGESKREISVLCMGAVAYLAGMCGADYALLSVRGGRIRPDVYGSGTRHLEETLLEYRRALAESAGAEENQRLRPEWLNLGGQSFFSDWLSKKGGKGPVGGKRKKSIPGKGRKEDSAFTEKVNPGAGTDGLRMIRFAAQHLRPNRIVVLITDQAGLAGLDGKTLERITWRDDLLVINIDDAYLTDGNIYDLDQGFYADTLFLNSRALCEEERAHRKEMLRERSHMLEKYRVPMVTIGSERQIVPKIVELFELAGR